MLNSRDVNLLRSDVAENCRRWLARCQNAGLAVLVTNTVRDAEYQSWLYEQGRTRPGSIVTNGKVPTFHHVDAGLAFDFCQNVKGKEYSDLGFFQAAAALAKEMGFSWGGDWTSFVDRPHIQWDGRGRYTSAMLRKGLCPPDMPLWEEDEEMTQETFDRMMADYLVRLGQQPPSDWSEDARRWAEQTGLIRGDENGNKRYKMFVTREELAALLQRTEQPAAEGKDESAQ